MLFVNWLSKKIEFEIFIYDVDLQNGINEPATADVGLQNVIIEPAIAMLLEKYPFIHTSEVLPSK